MDNQQNYQKPYYGEELEINLADYLRVIWRRKKPILTIFILVVIIAIITSFLMPKIYKIDTSLEIGGVGGAIIEQSTQLVEKIKGDTYGEVVKEKLQIPEAKYPTIKVESPKDTKLVKMTIESADPQKAKTILEEIDNLILVEHQEEIKVKIDLINQNIKTTEEQIKLTESDIEKTKNKIKPIESDIGRIKNKIAFAEEEKTNLEAKIEALQKVLPYQQDPGTQFALFDTKENLANKKKEIENLYMTINSLNRTKEDLEVQINRLKKTIEDLNSQINTLKASLDDIKPTKIVKNPTVSDWPIKPNKKLNVIISGILGLFVAIFYAFIAESFEKSKKSKNI